MVALWPAGGLSFLVHSHIQLAFLGTYPGGFSFGVSYDEGVGGSGWGRDHRRGWYCLRFWILSLRAGDFEMVLFTSLTLWLRKVRPRGKEDLSGVTQHGHDRVRTWAIPFLTSGCFLGSTLAFALAPWKGHLFGVHSWRGSGPEGCACQGSE
jgi:hypothetical protein